MYVVTPKEMNAIDKLMAEHYAVPTLLLMENAGNAIATYLTQNYGVDSKIVFITGSGNNGGDGWCAARLMHARGYRVKVVSLCGKDRMGELVQKNCEMAELLGVDITLSASTGDIGVALLGCDVAVDAILGTGISGSVKQETADIIALINNSGRNIVSVDLPSGINAEDGSVCGVAVQADAVIVLGTLKQGLLFAPARNCYKKLVVDNISIPNEIFRQNSAVKRVLYPQDVKVMLKARKSTSHKGTFGKLGIIAGSPGMTGAACLCANAALKSGAGIIQVAIPRSLNSILEVKLTEQMSTPMPENDFGALSHSKELMDFCDGKSALVIGPGLSRKAEGEKFIPEILRTFNGITVLDADGLNIIAKTPEILTYGRCIITPHLGEMARLCGLSVGEIEKNQTQVAIDFVKKYGVTVVLKNYITVIASPDGEVVFNLTGNEGMATGGSGDVLSGIIGSLCAQGYSAFDAAALGAYINGAAADIAAEKISKISLCPGDTVDNISNVFINL